MAAQLSKNKKSVSGECECGEQGWEGQGQITSLFGLENV